MKIAKEPISLETPIGDEEDSHLGDFIEDKNAVIPVDAAIQANLKETVTRVLASLTPREERVLRMRFGIGMNTDHTLEEVGQQFWSPASASGRSRRRRCGSSSIRAAVAEDAVVPRSVSLITELNSRLRQRLAPRPLPASIPARQPCVHQLGADRPAIDLHDPELAAVAIFVPVDRGQRHLP